MYSYCTFARFSSTAYIVCPVLPLLWRIKVFIILTANLRQRVTGDNPPPEPRVLVSLRARNMGCQFSDNSRPAGRLGSEPRVGAGVFSVGRLCPGSCLQGQLSHRIETMQNADNSRTKSTVRTARDHVVLSYTNNWTV